MRVDERRQHDPTAERQPRRVAMVRRAGGGNIREAARVDQNVDFREAVAVDGRELGGQDPRRAQHIAGNPRDLEPWRHASRLRALSCQRRNSR